MHDATIIEAVRRHAVPVDVETAAQRLLDAIDLSVSMVLIGEATYGTEEFYRVRADLTRALVRQRGFDIAAIAAALAGPRPERAIGVIYRPETERASRYFSARLPRQFDLVVRVDRTRALEPLERWGRHEIDLPETSPTGV